MQEFLSIDSTRLRSSFTDAVLAATCNAISIVSKLLLIGLCGDCSDASGVFVRGVCVIPLKSSNWFLVDIVAVVVHVSLALTVGLCVMKVSNLGCVLFDLRADLTDSALFLCGGETEVDLSFFLFLPLFLLPVCFV